jgi:NAD-dependent deacetylase
MNEFVISNQLRGLLMPTTRVAILTGAGVSAESGVPTFRGAEGLWSKFRPEELANFDAFMANPRLVLEWYDYRRELMNTVQPNPGHETLARWEKYFNDFALITQNVDGLHRRAGSTKIHELHGNILKNKCSRCNRPAEWPHKFDPENLPTCECGGLLRPDVVWFGELLPARVIEEAWAKAEACELFFSLGTSAVVQPAASLPMVAKRAGAYVVEVNPEDTPLSGMCDEVFHGPSGEILPQITKHFSDDPTGV